MKLLIMKFSPLPFTSSLLGPNILLNTLSNSGASRLLVEYDGRIQHFVLTKQHKWKLIKKEELVENRFVI
jgi:hypothetical protein